MLKRNCFNAFCNSSDIEQMMADEVFCCGDDVCILKFRECRKKYFFFLIHPCLNFPGSSALIKRMNETVATPQRQLVDCKGSWTPSEEIFIGTPQSFERQRYLRQDPPAVDGDVQEKSPLPIKKPSLAIGKTTSSVSHARSSSWDVSKLRTQSVITPCRIPIPVGLKSSRMSLPGNTRTLNQNKPASSTKKLFPKNILSLPEKGIEINTVQPDIQPHSDVGEKLKMLEVLRQKKLLLEQQLLESSQPSRKDEPPVLNHADQANTSEPLETKPEPVVETVFESTSEINEAQSQENIAEPVMKEAEAIPSTVAPVDMAQIILQHLNQLSGRELEKLTIINTNTNKTYIRPIVYKNVVKHGPIPDSPNAKVIQKLRDAENESEKMQNIAGDDTEPECTADQEETTTGGVKWRSRKSLVQIMKTPDRDHETRQCRLNKQQGIIKSHNHDFSVNVSNSPVCVQRITYKQEPQQQPKRAALNKPASKTAKSVTPRKPRAIPAKRTSLK